LEAILEKIPSRPPPGPSSISSQFFRVTNTDERWFAERLGEQSERSLLKRIENELNGVACCDAYQLQVRASSFSSPLLELHRV
jgi:hypothetical protein